MSRGGKAIALKYMINNRRYLVHLLTHRHEKPLVTNQ